MQVPSSTTLRQRFDAQASRWFELIDRINERLLANGYCPLTAYLGTQGYCLQRALRPGTQHSASETHYNLEHVLPLGRR
jgi:DNA-binding ferritin-like protein